MSTAVPVLPRATPTSLGGILLFVAVGLAHLPLVGLHLWEIRHKEYYQYMPLVPIGALMLAMKELRDERRAVAESEGVRFTLLTTLALVASAAVALYRVYRLSAPVTQSFELSVMLFALLEVIVVAYCAFGQLAFAPFGVGALALAYLLNSPWAAILSLVINLGTTATLAGGKALALKLRPAATFLLLMLPLPRDTDADLLQWLQRATVAGSGAVYEWAGGYCMIVGAVVQLPHLTEPLFIADACSGIQSLFAVMTCTVFYLLWNRRGPIQSFLVLAVAFGWVMAANVARVLAVMAFTKPGVLDLSKGWPHQALGMLTFMAGLLLTLSTDRLFLVFNPPREEAPPPAEEDEAAPPRARTAYTAGALALAGVLLVVGGLSAKRIFTSAQETGTRFTFEFEVPVLGPNHLPETLGDWRLVKYEGEIRRAPDDNMAARSQQWRYTNGFQNALLSLDYPYPTTHDLQGCYENIGWSLASRDLLDVPTSYVPPAGDYVRLKLQKRSDEYAYVAFSAFTLKGEPETLGRVRLWDDLENRGLSFYKRFLGRGEDKVRLRQPIYQLQLYSESPLPMTPDQIVQLDRLFALARQQFVPPKMTLSGK